MRKGKDRRASDRRWVLSTTSRERRVLRAFLKAANTSTAPHTSGQDGTSPQSAAGGGQ